MRNEYTHKAKQHEVQCNLETLQCLLAAWHSELPTKTSLQKPQIITEKEAVRLRHALLT